MVVIRLSRGGTTHRPKYRVTVADNRYSPTGRYIEVVGNYNPLAKEGAVDALRLDLDKINAWIQKGAQPTKRVKSLIKKAQAASNS